MKIAYACLCCDVMCWDVVRHMDRVHHITVDPEFRWDIDA